MTGRRANGEGMFLDLGGGRWAYRRTVRGKRIQKSATAATEAKAKRLAKSKVEEEIKLLEAGVNPSSGNVKLGDYAQVWLDDRQPRRDNDGNLYLGVQETTFDNYRRDVRRIQQYIGSVPIGQFRSTHASSMSRRMAADGLSPEVQRTTMVRLGTILNLAEARGDVVKNYAAARLVERPKVPKREHPQASEDDLQRLLRAVEGDPLEALVWLGLGAGLRRQELLGLHWEDVEFLSPELAVLRVRRRVNYGARGVNRLVRTRLKNDDALKRVHVGSLVLDVLRRRWVYQLAQRRAAQEPGHRRWQGVDYQPDQREGYIFTNPTDGKPMNPRSADKYFAALRERTGLSIERFHALRHVFTTLLRASGTRDRVVMRMTGHRDPAMLDHYDDGMESEQVAAARALNSRLQQLLLGNEGDDEVTVA